MPRFEQLDDAHFAAHVEDTQRELSLLQQVVAEAGDMPPHQQLGHIAAAARAVRDRIVRTPIAAATADAIARIIATLDTTTVAVRSDMRGEDSAAFSYAGQLDSFLFVELPSVQTAVLHCWASAFSDRAVLYSMRSGISPRAIQMSVVIQEMIAADTAGVAFSIDPSTGRDECLIAAAWGVGEGVVSGAADSDEYRWNPEVGEIKAEVPVKDTKISRGLGGGTAPCAVDDELRAQRVLTPQQVAAVGTMCKALQYHLKIPVDVEWCWKKEQLYVLQARPITSLSAAHQPQPTALRSFDNCNIQESFNGYTTPLTFSFASHAYRQVFMDFVRSLGVSKTRLSGFEIASRCMLAYLSGRVYYNLSSWYQMLALLPWYETNRQETEKVMWHLEKTGAAAQARPDSMGDRARKLWVGLTIVGRLMLLPITIPRFVKRFETRYRSVDRASLSEASIDVLQSTLEVIYQDFMRDWRTPNLNDFKVMMSCGRLRRVVEYGRRRGATVNVADLLAGIEGIESLRPTEEIADIADRIRADASLAALFADPQFEAASLLEHLERGAIGHQVAAYIERYGDRTAGELKLETMTIRDSPVRLVGMIRAHLDAGGRFASSPGKTAYRNARQQLMSAVPIWTRVVLGVNLRLARRAVADRERLRLLRTYAFGIARDTYRAYGNRLHELGVLQNPTDVYYLTIDEIAAYCEARAVSACLRDLVQLRRDEHARYLDVELPNRIDIDSIPYLLDLTEHDDGGGPGPDGTVLVGLGCAPGVAEGPAVIVDDPHSAAVLNSVICAVRTDPGWAPLFPAATGLVIERGSTLSHSAVIARELGIPTVVGVQAATRIINDGELIRVDGERGQVYRLDQLEKGQ